MTIWIAMALTVLDGPVIAFALHAMSVDLAADTAKSVWAVTSYQIAIIAGLLPFSALGEAMGYRRIYLCGLLLFVGASVACGLSEDILTLSLARFAQGLGAGAIMSVNGALVRHIYPPAHLARGFGYNAAVIALASAAAPAISATILTMGSWRWIFAVNLPFGLFAALVGFWVLPRAKGARQKLNPLEAGLCAAGFALLFVGLSGIVHHMAWPAALALCVAGLAALLILAQQNWHAISPLLPLDLIRIPKLRRAYGVAIFAFATQLMALIAIPLILQGSARLGFAASGAVMTAWPVGVIIAGVISGRLTEWRTQLPLVGIGLILLALGLLGIAVTASPATISMMLLCALCGLGFGLFQSSNSRTMMTNAPIQRSGAAAGMLALTRLIGQTLGSLIVAWTLTRMAAVRPPLMVAAALAMVGAVLAARHSGEKQSKDRGSDLKSAAHR
jgi:DHA2 family multidrug resistance protein-like MFS transporter